MASGKAEEAIPIYEELLQIAPGNAVLHVNLAVALFEAARYRDAIERSQRALSLEPNLTHARLFLGASYLKAGEPAQAIGPLEAVIAARPGERNAALMLAEALLAVGRNADAVDRFLDASKLLPDEPRVWYGLERGCEGVVTSTLQNLSPAGLERPYRDSLAGDAAAAAGHYAQAVELYKQALAGRPNAREVWRALAHLYRESGHPDWAEQAESRRSALPSPDCKSHPAACAFEAANYEAAYQATDGARPEGKYWRAKSCRELSEQAVERLVAIGESQQLYEIQARRLDRRGMFAESAGQWQKAIDLDPANSELKKGLAIALYRSADFGRAVAILKDLIAAEADSSEWNYMCGHSLLLSERPAEALPYLRRALELGSTPGHAEAALGQALLQLGRFDEAILHLETAAKSEADSQLLFQLVRAYRGTGQSENATRALGKYKQARASELGRQRAEQNSNEISPP